MLFVNGELRIIYTNTDESVIKKVDEAFRQVGYRYDFDHVRLKNGVKVNGWGNEGYSEARIRQLLESLKNIAPTEEYIFKNGNWKYQTGKLVYEDSEVE